jgi:hypothetical protein
MAVAFGIIREVYAIHSWKRFAVEDVVKSDLRRNYKTQRKSKVRWAFSGEVATDVRDRFVGKSFLWPSQSAFLWINC